MYGRNKIYCYLMGWFGNKAATLIVCFDTSLLAEVDQQGITMPAEIADDVVSELGFTVVEIWRRSYATVSDESDVDMTHFIYGRDIYKGRKWQNVMNKAKQYINDVILKDEI